MLLIFSKMNIIEIYEILRDVTLTKAKILEEVMDNKYSIELKHSQIDANENEQGYECNASGDKTKEREWRVNEDSELAKLTIQLDILRKQECGLREQRNQRMGQRMETIMKGKQLQVMLEQLSDKQRVEQIAAKSLRVAEKPITTDEEQYEILYLQYLSIREQVEGKQQQGIMLSQQIQLKKGEVDKVHQDYQALEDSIDGQKERISSTKKQLQQHQFQYQRALIQNTKLTKELMLANDRNLNLRGLEKKVKEIEQAHQKVKQNYMRALANKQKYMDKIVEIKQVLQI